MTTNHLSFDCNALGQLYAPFEPTGNNCGWNLDDGGQAYFVSQGSEYQLSYPQVSLSTAPLGSDLIAEVQAFTDALLTLLEQNSSDPSLAQSLSTWCNDLVAGGNADQLTVTATALHLRNTSGDDQADLSYSFVYCDPLGLAILLQHTVNIDWAGSLAGASGVVLGLGKSMDALLSLYKDAFKIMGVALTIPGADVIAAIGLASGIILDVGKLMLTESDDGGRLNFLGVLAHTLVRVSSCVAPHSQPSSKFPVVQVDRLTAAWQPCKKNSTLDSSSTPYQAGTVFGDYPADSWDYTVNTQNTLYAQPYVLFMPEQSWSLGALPLTFTTFKIDSNPKVGLLQSSGGSTVFALTAVIACPAGNLVCTGLQCASAVKAQFALGDPAWQPYTAENVENLSLTDYIEDVIYYELGLTDVQTNQLSFVIPQQTWAVLESLSLASTLQQPWMVADIGKQASSTPYDTGDAPSVAVQMDGSLIECHDNRNANISNLYWNFGKVSDNSTSVEWASTNHGTKYEAGSWPALTTDPVANQCIVEVHNYGSDIYLNFGNVSTSKSSVSFVDDDNSSSYKIGGSDRPAVWQSQDGIVVIMYVNGGTLRYQTAYYDGSDTMSAMQMRSGEKDYTSGDCPTVIRDKPSNTVLEVHENDGLLWYNTGTMSADNHYDSIAWGKGPYPLMVQGANPHLTWFNSSNVLLTYDNHETVYGALGRIVAGSVQWYLVNLPLFSGKWAALSAVPNAGDLAVICYNAGDDQLVSNMLRPQYPA